LRRGKRNKICFGRFYGERRVAKKIKKKKTEAIVIRKDLCKGCGICVAFCPTHVLELGEDEKAEVKRLEDCTGCGLCEMRCPDLAIEVYRANSKEHRA
jgi:2-oxoglutarate ferredoxin oxidoreductase subunit delta